MPLGLRLLMDLVMSTCPRPGSKSISGTRFLVKALVQIATFFALKTISEFLIDTLQ
jgi:hypothetical protein